VITIQDCLTDQEKLQELLGHPMGEGEQAVKENILALIVEATEVLDHFNWKKWKKEQKEINKSATVLEMMDLFKFAFNILVLLEVDEAYFKMAWDTTTAKVMKRYSNDY
jgi:dimeric dUTPase (all-alpha-NTP-PPase superfamily)